MRTTVRTRFTGPTVAVVQAQLRATGCGDDVATIEDIPVLKQVFVEVTLDEGDARVAALFARLEADGAKWTVWHEDLFTEEEKESARLILLHPNGTFEVGGGVKWGTTFDLSGACPACATGCHQTSALFIDGEEANQLEGHRVAVTYFWHILVDERLASALENAAVTGLSFRSVYALMPDGRQTRLRWRQLVAEHTLPRMSPRTSGVERMEQSEKLLPCEVCKRNGFLPMRAKPTRVVYRSSDLTNALDVNSTWENYWCALLDREDFRRSVLSRPWTVVTPKVYRIFREAGVTELEYHPIRVEDG